MEGQPTILVVEDSDATRVFLERQLASEGYDVAAASNVQEGRQIIESRTLDLALVDLGLGRGNGRDLLRDIRDVSPDVPVVIVTSDNTATSAVELLRKGAYDYVVKPVEGDQLLRLVRRGVELCTARRALGNMRDVRNREVRAWDVGTTPRMQTIKRLVDKFAPTQAGVLIEGESGTGKEVVARAIHALSMRPEGAFIAINCAALPGQLLESQLFGHERGSFTGATAMQRGLLELADGGTLFLDEVTMMSPEMQAKLLRALQEFRIRRVGGQKEIKVDVRVISASNQHVLDAIAAGRFREDLYFRLCVITLDLPPLRMRQADIPFFVAKFVAELREEMGTSVTGVSDAALWALGQYHWPGNIRELRNVVERAVILASGEDKVDVVHLPEIVGAVETAGASAPAAGDGCGHLPSVLPSDGLDLKELELAWERSMIEQALDRTDGNQSGAARLLGLSRDELRYRVDKFALAD